MILSYMQFSWTWPSYCNNVISSTVVYLLNFLKNACSLSFFLRFYLFPERGERRETERERNINVWLPLTCPTPGNLACNPGMCPDWELNQQPFSLQANTQSTELHQSGLFYTSLNYTMYYFLCKSKNDIYPVQELWVSEN